MKRTFFTLSSARSGTLYLRYLFQNNVPNCICRHEPFFDWGNPTLFGPAVYDAYAGRVDRIRRRLEKKRAYIERRRGDYYLESSHAFLKSAYLAALDVFPDLRLIHLLRDPVAVARSSAWRELWRRRVHAPFHFYRGDDGRRHFAWALTGNEEIFQAPERGLSSPQPAGALEQPVSVSAPERDRALLRTGKSALRDAGSTANPGASLSLFQWYLLEWIEIENRAMRFLDEHHLHDRCFTLVCPGDLNNPARLRAMFDFFGLPTRSPEIVLAGRKNRSIGYSPAERQAHEREADAVLENLPARYLEIFHRPPYTQCAWADRLRRPAQRLSVTSARSAD